MKKVIKTDKLSTDIHSKLYSDLHYSPNDDLSFFYKEIEEFKKKKIDYTFFLGDIIDDARYTLDELRELLEIFKTMAKYSKVLMVFGNHDYYTKLEDGFWIEHDYDKSITEFKNLGITVLENELYSDELINAYGLSFDANYYESDEPLLVFEGKTEEIEFDERKYNILMSHSPYRTFDRKVIDKHSNLQSIDLTLAGHYHNGCIPWYLPIPTNRGIISPTLSLFPDNARGSKWITDTNFGIIASPVTTFASRTRLGWVNKMLYPPVTQDIIIKSKRY